MVGLNIDTYINIQVRAMLTIMILCYIDDSIWQYQYNTTLTEEINSYVIEFGALLCMTCLFALY